MKLELRLITYLVFAVVVLGLSNIYLWLDRKDMWKIMETQAIMINRLYIINDKPFIYEDELPETFTPELDLLVSSKPFVLQVD